MTVDRDALVSALLADAPLELSPATLLVLAVEARHAQEAGLQDVADRGHAAVLGALADPATAAAFQELRWAALGRARALRGRSPAHDHLWRHLAAAWRDLRVDGPVPAAAPAEAVPVAAADGADARVWDLGVASVTLDPVAGRAGWFRARVAGPELCEVAVFDADAPHAPGWIAAGDEALVQLAGLPRFRVRSLP